MPSILLKLFIVLSCLFTFACSKEVPKEQSFQGVLITTTNPTNQAVELVEETVGSLESIIDPTVSAEIAGRIEKMYVRPGDHVKRDQVMAQIDAQDAKLAIQASLSEVKRIETLLANQKRTTARYQELREDNYVSQSMLEDALANERVLQEQLKAAQANMAIHEHNLAKTKVTSPIDAFIDKQISSEGAFVRTGDPIFQIVTTGLLRARLPFPESMASHLKPTLTVRLSTPTSPNDIITAKIKEIKPMTSTTSRALDAIVELNNTGAWKPGSSVKAIVVLATKPNALMVPEQSVVLRPAGKVVYIIEHNKAKPIVIETGLKQNGLVEVIRGLNGQETIAVDGAGFLSEGTAVKVQQG